MRHLRRFMLIVFLIPLTTVVRGQDTATEGQRLAKIFDEMNVEKLWAPGKRVNWKTGELLEKQVDDGKSRTHCSAFVAATCQKLDVYILRPPEHSTTLLANAQYDWLHREGKKHGWERVATAAEAQQLANRGSLVVAVCKNGDDVRPGHIALVRPSTRSDEAVKKDGPQIIQAGRTNYNSTNLREGFKNHPGAWDKGEVHFFVHGLKAK